MGANRSSVIVIREHDPSGSTGVARTNRIRSNFIIHGPLTYPYNSPLPRCLGQTDFVKGKLILVFHKKWELENSVTNETNEWSVDLIGLVYDNDGRLASALVVALL